MIDWPKLSEKVRVHRAIHQIDQKDAAAQIGVVPSTLCRLEAGKTVNADGFMSVCKWLGIQAEETLT